MVVRPSVRQHRTTQLSLDELCKHLILGNFSKSLEKIHAWLKSDKCNVYFR